MKTCSHCHCEKPLGDFSPSKRYRDGHASRCKLCQSVIMHARRVDHPEKERAQRAKDNKKWRTSPQGIAYMEEHANERHAYDIKYRITNAEEIAHKSAIYYQKNKERMDSSNAVWRHANPGKWMAIHDRWLANKKGAEINDFTDDQWLEILAVYSYRCVWCPPDCRKCRNHSHELTEDHITPLSKGGDNTASNIVPACRSCNARKNAGPVPKPVQPLLLTISPPKPKRTRHRRIS